LQLSCPPFPFITGPAGKGLLARTGGPAPDMAANAATFPGEALTSGTLDSDLCAAELERHASDALLGPALI
jgi:hypothetical protein